MKVLVTGAAGFIGSTLVLRLLARGDTVIGIDNHNDYYDPAIKEARLERFANHPKYTHLRIDLADRKAIFDCFTAHSPQRVVNLAAQAGVRYSIENPLAYIDSNIVGFAHILEGCRHNGVDHLVYASSSSVYGANTAMPFSVHQNVDHPLSLYAASKKSNELMAHTYSHLYSLPTTGLRFFTVYGPWGRPDMALFKFTKAALAGEPIDVYGHGRMERDFTFIDDAAESITRLLHKLPEAGPGPGLGSELGPYRVFNVGNGQPVVLSDFIDAMERSLGRPARRKLLPLQPGDMSATACDATALQAWTGFAPATPMTQGVQRFADWFIQHYPSP